MTEYGVETQPWDSVTTIKIMVGLILTTRTFTTQDCQIVQIGSRGHSVHRGKEP